MKYICKECAYEFTFYQPVHTHTSIIGRMGLGCPVCRKAEGMSKVCPRCGSKELNPVLPILPADTSGEKGM